MMAATERLGEALTAGDAVFFLGAGASYDSGLPLGDEGAETIIRLLFERAGHGELWAPLDAAASKTSHERLVPRWPRFEVVLDFLAQFTPSALHEIVATFAGIGLSSTHGTLASLAVKPALWLTTNFDDQIERALGSQPRTMLNERGAMPLLRRDETRHLILKLHGDGNTQDLESSLGARIDQILRRFPDDAAAALVELVRGRPLVIIGYAARDWDLLHLLHALLRVARSVAWIGYGDPPAAVQSLVAAYGIDYFGNGSPAALCEAARCPAAEAQPQRGAWVSRVAEWVARQDRNAIVQSLAELLLERDDIDARAAALRVQQAIDTPTSDDRYWIVKREAESILRADHLDRAALAERCNTLLRLAASGEYSPEVAIRARLSAAQFLLRTAGAEDAARPAEEALALADAAKDPLAIDALTILGTIDLYRGSESFAAALDRLRDAHRAARERDDPLRIINTANRLSVGLMRNKQAEEAAQLLRDSEAHINEVNAPRVLMVRLVNLAEALRIARRFAEAIDVNREAVEAARRFGDREVEMHATANLALCLVVTGQVGPAERMLEQAYDVAYRREGSETIGNTILNRGWMRMLLTRWKDAVPLLEKAAELLKERGSDDRAGSTWALAGWCHLRLGDTGRARAILDLIHERKIVPHGVLAGEYTMLQFGVTYADAPLDATLADARTKLAGQCEQLFQIALWIVDRVASQSLLRDEALSVATVAAAESRLTILDAVLEARRGSPARLAAMTAELES